MFGETAIFLVLILVFTPPLSFIAHTIDNKAAFSNVNRGGADLADVPNSFFIDQIISKINNY